MQPLIMGASQSGYHALGGLKAVPIKVTFSCPSRRGEVPASQSSVHGQQHQSPLGPCKCRLKPTPGLLDLLLCFNKIPEDLCTQPRLRGGVWGPGPCPHSPGSALLGGSPLLGPEGNEGERVGLLQTHRGGRSCSPGGHHPGVQVHLLWGGQPAPTCSSLWGPGDLRSWRPCHHPANSPQRSGQWSRVLPSPPAPPACLPSASSRSPVPVSGSGWGDRGSGPSWLVMRQIQQAVVADGELQTLDPPLITCQPSRPSTMPTSWNKRPFLIIFNKELFITGFVGAINMPGV